MVEKRSVQALHEGPGTVCGGTVLDPAQLGGGAWKFVDYWRIPPGAGIGAHRHDRGRELYYVVAGRGTMTTNGETFKVGAGDLILNEPGDTHGLVNTSDAELRLFVTCVSDGG